MYIVVGLGNPGGEFAETRHNGGRMAADFIADKELDGVKVLTPDTFMNKTGAFVAKKVKSKAAAKKLIVIYDDLDLPFGAVKISWDRGSGGHRGLDSIIRALKTREFIRIRIGIGKKGDVEKHILGKFTPKEKLELKKVFKKVAEAVEVITDEGLQKAMTLYNQG